MFRWLSKTDKNAEQLIAQGNRLEDAGDLARACELYRQAATLAPDCAKAHLNLGIGLEASGDAQGARASYEKALALEPQDAAANYNLGKLLFTQGALEEADDRLKRALAAKTDFPEARIVRGYVLQRAGDADGAATELEAGIQARPADAHASLVLARIRAAQGRSNDALVWYEIAVAAAPAPLDALFELAGLQAARGELEQALQSYRRLLTHKPDAVAALCNEATTLKLLGRKAEAIESYRRAVTVDPRFADAHYNLGVAYRDQSRSAEAIDAFRRAIELEPGMADAHAGLGHALRDLDRKTEALAVFRHALELDPDNVMARWSLTMAQLPVVYGYGEDAGVFRRQFAADLVELERWFTPRRMAKGAIGVGTDQPFELAYQEENNRELLARYGALCSRLMAHWRQEEKVPAPAERRAHCQPLRVGVVSAHLRSHSVWSAITKGWFESLDPERFAFHAFHIASETDAQTAWARARSAHFDRGPKELRHWVDAIQAQRPDVLIYPEVGMDPMTVRLASQRLAPVQVATWGHPETTGLPTIDYYLSGEDLEPQDARANYTEELVLLPRLGCHFGPVDLAPSYPDPTQAGIDPAVPLFVCPGVPFKYAPQFDWVFPEIARRLGKCRFIFFSHATHTLSERLSRRLQAVFEAHKLDYNRHVTFIPWQKPAGFLGWLRRADVYLDTIGFSGFNTALYAVESSLPIVAREGRFLRGRLASGILKRLGLAELVAPTEQGYVDLAVKLAQDSDYRQSVARRMDGARQALYHDTGAMRAMEDFLSRVAADVG